MLNEPEDRAVDAQTASGPPPVPLWQIWGLRIIFAGMAFVLGWQQWSSIFEGTAEWSAWKGLGRSMLAMLAVLAFIGIFHPLKVLVLMLYEMAWKTLWLLGIALPAYLDGREVPTIVEIVPSSIGMVLLLFLIPWRYLWWQWVVQPLDPWRRSPSAPAMQTA